MTNYCAPEMNETEFELATKLEQQVKRRTGGMLRNLKVDVLGSEVVLTGHAASYYAKQLATHAVLSMATHATVTNDLEVF
jgi:hypothetical protein